MYETSEPLEPEKAIAGIPSLTASVAAPLWIRSAISNWVRRGVERIAYIVPEKRTSRARLPVRVPLSIIMVDAHDTVTLTADVGPANDQVWGRPKIFWRQSLDTVLDSINTVSMSAVWKLPGSTERYARVSVDVV